MTSLTAPETKAPAESEAPQRSRTTVGRRLVPYGYLSPTVLLVVVLTVICNELLRGIEEFRKSRRRGFR